jgi:hypothetical protein
VDCPADLIPGVLALYPNSGDGSQNPFAVVVPEYRVRWNRTTGASLLVAPPNPDVCEASSATGDVQDGLKLCANALPLRPTVAIRLALEDGGSALPDAE